MAGAEHNGGDGGVKLAGVVGWPAAHSLSPEIHRFWAARAGVNGYYVALPVAADSTAFVKAMGALQTLGFAGVNVTIPHKANAIAFAKDASALARRAGAANMISFRPDGPYADNSDVAGLSAAIRAQTPSRSSNATALVLGAGGAARAAVLAMEDLGVKHVIMANRTREKAEAVGADLGARIVDWDARSDALDGVDILVNATSLGMAGQSKLIINLSKLSSNALVADIVYSPLETELLKTAKEMGRTTVSGLDMLMHQAVLGFRAWFGADAHVDEELRQHLITTLNKRSRV